MKPIASVETQEQRQHWIAADRSTNGREYGWPAALGRHPA